MGTLEDWVGRGWDDHAADAAGVFARFGEGVALATEPRHAAPLAALVVHVAGEHLGRWADGLALLDRIEAGTGAAEGTLERKAIDRSRAALHRCAGDSAAESRCEAASRNDAFPPASNRVRVLAVAAAAMLGQKRVADARRDFEECVSLAEYGPSKDDPAARALAVTANNVASELETRAGRTADETSLMLRAAEVARIFWGIAGGWMEAERAEYRLAMSRLAAGDAAAALRHAGECLRIVTENGSDPGEAFFAHEAHCRAHRALGDAAAAAASRAAMESVLPSIADEGFRAYCAGELAKL
ncbi:MAG: hypothetical protein HMLKMBBP_01758 [Planctomycetes bacterium]|nr:hypothetical protein [Planctomycetota bacterium]